MSDEPRMQWSGERSGRYGAEHIVHWVEVLGGEARYEPANIDAAGNPTKYRDRRLAVRTIDGWSYAAPGDSVVISNSTFLVEPQEPKPATVCVRLDGLADKIAAAIHSGWCPTGCPFPTEREQEIAAMVTAALPSLAVQ